MSRAGPWWMRPLVALALTLIVIGCAQKELKWYREYAAKLQLAEDMPVYVSMASNLRYGFFLHSARTDAAFAANPYGYRAHPTDHPGELQGFYQNDGGLSLLIWLADTIYANRASPVELLTWLQMTVAVLNVFLMFYVGRRIAGDGMGLLCAAMYAGLSPFVLLAATFPYYYYWQGAFAVCNLAFAIHLSHPDLPGRRLAARVLPAAACGLVLGLAAMVRSSFLAVGAITAAFLLVRNRRRWRRMVPVAAAILVAQVLVMTPLFYRSYERFGRLMPPRLFWHTVYVGMGWWPNPYGIKWDDHAAFSLAKAHGVDFSAPDWIVHYESFLHGEVARIQREDPWLMPRNTVLNFCDGLVVFDDVLKFKLAAGRLGVFVDLPTRHAFIVLLVLPQIGYFAWRLRRRAEAWYYAAAVGQGLYFLLSVSMLCPPFLGYNAAYLPTFAIGVAGTVLAALCGMRAGARALAARMRPAAAGPGLAR